MTIPQSMRNEDRYETKIFNTERQRKQANQNPGVCRVKQRNAVAAL